METETKKSKIHIHIIMDLGYEDTLSLVASIRSLLKEKFSWIPDKLETDGTIRSHNSRIVDVEGFEVKELIP